MDRLGPFEPSASLAVAVSGGADSMALAILTRDWAIRRNGSVLALVVDHGLRPGSADEARITIERLARLGIQARLLLLSGLTRGPSLAERARIRRYEALGQACRQSGILHLLLGHHAADQAETLAMRVLRGSRTHGLAGMSAIVETAWLRLLRPLLEIEPGRLRQFLAARDVDWVEDPSNTDLNALRPRLRHRFGDVSRSGLTGSIAAVAASRAREEAQTAVELASRAVIRPEGFALLSPGRIGAAALRCLVRTIGGAEYAPAPDQVCDLAARPRPATIAGVRIMRGGDKWLILREEAAIAAPVQALDGVIWDNRFRLVADGTAKEGGMIGTLGPDAAGFRTRSRLPSAVLRTLPAIRCGKVLAAVPHLGYVSQEHDIRMTILFSPRHPVAGASFVPASQSA